VDIVDELGGGATKDVGQSRKPSRHNPFATLGHAKAVERPRFTPAEVGLIATAAAIVFTRVFAFSLVLPGFHAYGLTLTSNEVLIGVALGAYALTMALAQLAMGILSDRLGRRRIILLGSALFVAGSIWAANTHSISQLIAARLLQGLGGVSSAAMAAVGETVPEERRTMAMALVGIPAGAGFFAGFVLGPILAPYVDGMPGLFWFTAVLGVVAVMPLLVRPLPAALPHLVAPGDRRSLTLPVMSLAAAGFTINFGMSAIADYLDKVASLLTHTLLALILLAAFAVMAVVSRGVDRSRSSWQPIVAALLVLAAGAPLFILGGSTSILLAGGVAFFAGHSVLSAVLPSQVSRLAGRSGGRGHGIQLVVAYLGTAAGGPVAGRFYGTPAWTFVVLGALAAFTATLVVMSLRPLQSRAPAASASSEAS
jgi:MFS family permease